MTTPILEIVLTGGPCSGKSGAKDFLQERLAAIGVRAFFAPEVATLVISGGVPDLGQMYVENFPRYLQIQKQILKMHRSQRERFQELAALFPDEKRVIIYDRGEMDAVAYLGTQGREYFMALVKEAGLSLTEVRDSYDAVIHLVTAANGAEWAYTLVNNKARRESPEEAREADVLTQNAWTGHPHLRVIDNSTDFTSKLERTFQAITRVLGIPTPVEIERKYLLKGLPNLSDPGFSGAQRIEIEQTYLVSENPKERLRVRRRSQDGMATYYLTRKTNIGPGVRHEVENKISPSKYLELLGTADPKRSKVVKDRWCFLYRNQYFELDVVHEPKTRKCVLLEIELTEENDKIELPPFVEVDRDVTNDPSWSNASIAKG